MSPVEAAELVAMVAATYPVPGWEPETMKIWRSMIADLDDGITAHVIDDWIKTHDQRPSIAAIRRAVADKQLGNIAGQKLFMPPDEAWEYVHRCFGIVGQYRDFPDEHPLVKEAVERMGWIGMCRSENLDVLRGQFRMAYTALLERSLGEAAASQGAASMPQSLLPESANVGEVRRLTVAK